MYNTCICGSPHDTEESLRLCCSRVSVLMHDNTCLCGYVCQQVYCTYAWQILIMVPRVGDGDPSFPVHPSRQPREVWTCLDNMCYWNTCFSFMHDKCPYLCMKTRVYVVMYDNTCICGYVWQHVYMWLCMTTRVYVVMHDNTCICGYVWQHVYLWLCMTTRVSVVIYDNTCICGYVWQHVYMWLCMTPRVSVVMYVNTCLYLCMTTRVSVVMYVNTCLYLCMTTRVSVLMHDNTYICGYVCQQTRVCTYAWQHVYLWLRMATRVSVFMYGSTYFMLYEITYYYDYEQLYQKYMLFIGI